MLILLSVSLSKTSKKFHKMNPRDYQKSSREVVVHRNSKELKSEEEKNHRGEEAFRVDK